MAVMLRAIQSVTNPRTCARTIYNRVRETRLPKAAPAAFGGIWGQKTQINLIFPSKALHIPNFCCTFAASKVKERNITMKAVVYKTEEERLEALRKMVGMRKIWEAHIRELMANHPEMQVAQ